MPGCSLAQRARSAAAVQRVYTTGAGCVGRVRPRREPGTHQGNHRQDAIGQRQAVKGSSLPCRALVNVLPPASAAVCHAYASEMGQLLEDSGLRHEIAGTEPAKRPAGHTPVAAPAAGQGAGAPPRLQRRPPFREVDGEAVHRRRQRGPHQLWPTRLGPHSLLVRSPRSSDLGATQSSGAAPRRGKLKTWGEAGALHAAFVVWASTPVEG